jgi:hypothetical protein
MELETGFVNKVKIYKMFKDYFRIDFLHYEVIVESVKF